MVHKVIKVKRYFSMYVAGRLKLWGEIRLDTDSGASLFAKQGFRVNNSSPTIIPACDETHDLFSGRQFHCSWTSLRRSQTVLLCWS